MNNIMAKIITSGARRKVLTLFLKNPDSRFCLREIRQKTEEHMNAARAIEKARFLPEKITSFPKEKYGVNA